MIRRRSPASRVLLLASLVAGTMLTAACMGVPATYGDLPADPSVVATTSAVTTTTVIPSVPVVAPVSPGGRPAAATLPPQGWRRCTNDIAGYSIEYPDGWYTTQIRPSEVCTQFHPSVFTIPAESEYPLTALNAARLAEPPERPDTIFERILLWEQTTVLGRPALRYETSSTGEGLHAAGTRRYGYVIRIDGRLISVFTTAAPDEARLPAWKVVVDRAAATLRATAPGQIGN